MISSGSLLPFRKSISARGYLWLAGCALIVPPHFGLLEILISSLGLHRANSFWAGVISVWSQQSFEGGTRASGYMEYFRKSQLFQLLERTFR